MHGSLVGSRVLLFTLHGFFETVIPTGVGPPAREGWPLPACSKLMNYRQTASNFLTFCSARAPYLPPAVVARAAQAGLHKCGALIRCGSHKVQEEATSKNSPRDISHNSHMISTTSTRDVTGCYLAKLSSSNLSLGRRPLSKSKGFFEVT
jgi:hypothetical protein